MYLRVKRQQETSPGPHYSLVYEYVCVWRGREGGAEEKGIRKGDLNKKCKKISEIIPGTNNSMKKVPRT